ncbi:S1 family peptidase [Paenibacillus sp. GCM10023248]|uniref:S1 family peptidase n=1 Tax=unclassified Paenibacillus TaxID=185978 RepID=UPI0023796503|nr:S1 family peptidase [Paenibacillus sp. MAHUQ-63]MDD9266161.1 S1 family peptidase [Paenibacillus sp. MAHUQ-63]
MRKKSKILNFLSVGLLSIILVVPYNVTASEPNITQVQNSNEMQDNIKFRTEFGLNVNQEYIDNVIRDAKNKGKNNRFGAYLTDVEEKELDIRFNRQKENITTIIKHIENSVNSNQFATIFIDQKEGGRVKIGFKKKPDSVFVNELNEIYGTNDIELFETKYSQKELDQLNEQIGRDRNKLINLGISLSSVVTNVISGKVDIGLKHINEESLTKLKQLYPADIINVIQDNENRQNQASPSDNYRPLEAGLKITAAEGNSCTNGFTATGQGYNYLVTAGHCMTYAGYPGQQWYQGGGLVAYADRYQESGSVDAAVMKIDSANLTNQLFAYGTHNFLKFNTTQAYSSEVVGQTTCISGAVGGTNCGTLKSTSWSGFWGTTWFSGLRTANYTAQSGDSGAPVFFAYSLNGIHKGADSNNKYYSMITNVESALSIQARLY